MLRHLTIIAAMSLGVSHAALAANHTANTDGSDSSDQQMSDSSSSSMSGSGESTMSEIPQDVIFATSIIGMPTFIKGEEATVGPVGALADAIVLTDGP